MNIYDISQKAGVSIATVSRVLNGSNRVSPKTRDKVLAVMDQLGYVPNAFARGLGLKSMKTIGLLCPDASDAYLAKALDHLERGFRGHGYDCLLSCTGKALADRAKGVELLLGKHVDGLVLMGSTFVEADEKGNAYLRKAAAHTPLVLLNASYPCENVYCVLCDDYRATLEATQYLLDTGRKEILYLYHSRNYSGQKKLAGYKAGLERADVPVREELIRFFAEDKMSVPEVRDYLLALDREGLRFDAVLTSEDVLSVGAAKYARVTGKSVPEALSIIGYNNSSFCLCCEPELTSVDNKLETLCNQCVTTMLTVLKGEEAPQKTIFSAELVRRGSTL
ncbi:MAG TPA: LacI family DNA-binding transcriptional regulator [Candidatus Limiplasma sp.]|jgi:LacI family transcriptional regulator|nr:LacI family DNA-binding transcriptional regulator [Candidatus Limiplasma sp.]